VTERVRPRKGEEQVRGERDNIDLFNRIRRGGREERGGRSMDSHPRGEGKKGGGGTRKRKARRSASSAKKKQKKGTRNARSYLSRKEGRQSMEGRGDKETLTQFGFGKGGNPAAMGRARGKGRKPRASSGEKKRGGKKNEPTTTFIRASGETKEERDLGKRRARECCSRGGEKGCVPIIGREGEGGRKQKGDRPAPRRGKKKEDTI